MALLIKSAANYSEIRFQSHLLPRGVDDVCTALGFRNELPFFLSLFQSLTSLWRKIINAFAASLDTHTEFLCNSHLNKFRCRCKGILYQNHHRYQWLCRPKIQLYCGIVNGRLLVSLNLQTHPESTRTYRYMWKGLLSS